MPDPLVLDVAVTADAEADRGTLRSALRQLAAGDPSLSVAMDDPFDRATLHGTSEAHLEGAIRHLRQHTRGVAVSVGPWRIAYRETLKQRVEIDYTHKTQTSGIGAFARVKLVVAPVGGGGFEPSMPSGVVPADLVAGVQAGVAHALRAGVLAGFPVIDVEVALVDGAYHAQDSSARTFEIATCAAVHQALHDGGSMLLEPIMTVEITMPATDLTSVLADVQARGGIVRSQRSLGDDAGIEAIVPLARALGYADHLRANTRGRGTAVLKFSHYAPAPGDTDDDGPAAPAIALPR